MSMEIPTVELSQLVREKWQSLGTFDTEAEARAQVPARVARENARKEAIKAWGRYHFEEVKTVVIAKLSDTDWVIMVQEGEKEGERARDATDLKAFQDARYQAWRAEYRKTHPNHKDPDSLALRPSH